MRLPISRRSVSSCVSPGPRKPDAALLALEVGPAAHQARRQVTELRELDLELALGAPRPPREDVEDEAGAVEHALADQPLEVALLGGRQLVVDEHEIRGFRAGAGADFLRLAAADEIARLGCPAIARDGRDGNGAGGARERVEFGEFIGVRRMTEADADEDCAFAALRTLEQGILPALRSSGLRDGRLFLDGIAGRQAHVPRRHDGRDGVLVHHLAHGVLQQHHELVERVHLPLELDAIDQIDGNRHALLA
jgi:hypothetical protein